MAKHLQWVPVAELKAFLKEYKAPVLGNLAICIFMGILSAEFSLRRQIPALNDYAVYYYASKMFFNPAETLNIYNYDYMRVTYGTVQFRYLPSFLVLFYPLTLVDMPTSSYVFTAIGFCLNVLSAFYVTRILFGHLEQPKTRDGQRFMVLILLGLFQAWNYGLGQVMAPVLFTGITSLYYFMEGKNATGWFLLGFSIVVKPVLVFVVIFAFLATKTFRGKIKAVLSILPPFILDCIIFMAIPQLLLAIITRNVTDFEIWRVYASTSLSSLLYMSFGLNPSWAFLITSIAMIFVGWIVLRSMQDQNRDKRISFSFVYGMLCFMVAQVQVWSHNLVVLVPLLLVATAYTPERAGQRLWKVCMLYQVSILVYFEQKVPVLALFEPLVQAINVGILLFITGTVLWQFYEKRGVASDRVPGNAESPSPRMIDREA
nr:glycosyltransferase 87 family protein [Candidatus Sigynarchaeum springense]